MPRNWPEPVPGMGFRRPFDFRCAGCNRRPFDFEVQVAITGHLIFEVQVAMHGVVTRAWCSELVTGIRCRQPLLHCLLKCG